MGQLQYTTKVMKSREVDGSGPDEVAGHLKKNFKIKDVKLSFKSV